MCFETVSVFRDRFCYARMSSKLLWLKPAWLLRKDDTYQSKHALGNATEKISMAPAMYQSKQALGTTQRRLAWLRRKDDTKKIETYTKASPWNDTETGCHHQLDSRQRFVFSKTWRLIEPKEYTVHDLQCLSPCHFKLNSGSVSKRLVMILQNLE